MKAIRVNAFGGPEVLRLEEVEDPKPGPTQVVVRVRAVGVNPVDTYIRGGAYPMLPPLPYTPGTDAAGDVEAVGAGVTSVKPGDRVYVGGSLTGTYAEKTLCETDQVHPLPQQASYSQGAGVFVPYATSHRGLFHRGRSQKGETLLVHGASGGVGTAAVQWAHAFGMTVIGTAGTEEGLKLVRAQGADHAVNHRDPDYLKAIMDLTGGKGVDIILEMAANVNLGKDPGLLAKFGRVVVIGSKGPVEINPRDMMGRDADIRALTLWNAQPDELKEIHAAIRSGLEDGTLRPVIGEEIPLAEAARAHDAVLANGHLGKVVLTI